MAWDSGTTQPCRHAAGALKMSLFSSFWAELHCMHHRLLSCTGMQLALTAKTVPWAGKPSGLLPIPFLVLIDSHYYSPVLISYFLVSTTHIQSHWSHLGVQYSRKPNFIGIGMELSYHWRNEQNLPKSATMADNKILSLYQGLRVCKSLNCASSCECGYSIIIFSDHVQGCYLIQSCCKDVLVGKLCFEICCTRQHTLLSQYAAGSSWWYICGLHLYLEGTVFLLVPAGHD